MDINVHHYIHWVPDPALETITQQLAYIRRQGERTMASVQEVKVAAQKHRDAVDAFIARARADFDNLKALAEQGKVTAAELDELKATLEGGVQVVEAMDLDPNFPATAPAEPPI